MTRALASDKGAALVAAFDARYLAANGARDLALSLPTPANRVLVRTLFVVEALR
jgi:hypothetical protein